VVAVKGRAAVTAMEAQLASQAAECLKKRLAADKATEEAAAQRARADAAEAAVATERAAVEALRTEAAAGSHHAAAAGALQAQLQVAKAEAAKAQAEAATATAAAAAARQHAEAAAVAAEQRSKRFVHVQQAFKCVPAALAPLRYLLLCLSARMRATLSAVRAPSASM
jgi:hypothetical protein